MAVQQLDLFTADRLPRKPYCSDELGWTHIRTVEHALRHAYIQPNAPAFHFRFIFDVDRPGAALAAEDALLAAPNWVAVNPKNKHAHVAYEIAVPVGKGPNHRQAPMRLAAAIEAAYLEGLGADRGYAGVLCKNPMHPSWDAHVFNPVAYDLPTLADYVDLSRFNDRRRTTEYEQYGLGRNCTIFEKLRRWAYQHVDEYRMTAGTPQNAWLHACYERACTYNRQFAEPLDPRECSHIAKSVANWTWSYYRGKAESDRRFSALQAARGRKSGQQRRIGSEAEQKPWEGLGISRATYYRRKQNGVRLEP